MPDYDLLAIGDISLDIYLKISQSELIPGGQGHETKICFVHGTKIPVAKQESYVAGNSINVAIGANKLGLKCALYAETGDDGSYDRTVRELKDLGISTKFVIPNKNTETDIHPIIVSKNDRTIFSYHSDKHYKVRAWGNPKWIYYTSIGEKFAHFQKELVEYLKQNPHIILTFNPGTYQLKQGLDGIREIIQLTHVLFVNKTEAILLVGQELKKELDTDTPLELLHSHLNNLGAKLTVITDGKNGASAYDGKNLESVPSYPIKSEVRDMTGAGDSFTAAFLSALHHKKPLKEALTWGTINSASNIQEVGATSGTLELKQIETETKKAV